MRKTKKIFNNSGISLVEILIYTFIFALLAGGIFSLLNWLMSSNVKVKVMAETLDSASRGMEIMVSEVKAAKGVYDPPPPPAFLPNQLSLETTKYLPAGETSTYIDFYLCDSRLCLKKEGQNPVALTSDLVEFTSLSFTKISTTNKVSVQIQLQARYKSATGRLQDQAQVNLTSTAAIRD